MVDILPRNEINRIRYFTARVGSRDGDASQPQRQATYLRALATIPNISNLYYGCLPGTPCRRS